MKFKIATPQEAESLASYFNHLSEETRSYFAPHPFDLATITSICNGDFRGYRAFIGLKDLEAIAYTVIKNDMDQGELDRFTSYSVQINLQEDFILAPSVADAFQSKGIGSELLAFVEAELKKLGAARIILWGGVQARNQRAVRYYQKNGFQTLGSFWYDGLDNLDMIKNL